MNTPFIVAEISANHNASLDRALSLISAAAWAGADAVKFQLYDPKKMVPADLVIEAGPWAGRDARELYLEAMTPREWFPRLFECAKLNGVEAFSSVFDVDGLAYLESLGCPRYKIASFEILDLELIRQVAHAGKPMILSTGMASLDDVMLACNTAYTSQWHPNLLTLLKCTSAYPASAADANLKTMWDMSERFGCDVGLSDHTLGLAVAVAAAALGASMIEKHLTLRRSDGGPDAAFSSEPEEFAAMVKACREAAAAIGEVRYGPTDSELAHMPLRGRTMKAARS